MFTIISPLFEILCLFLVISSFVRNIKNWKANICTTAMFLFFAYNFMKTIAKYKGVSAFMGGSPLCTKQSFSDGGICIHWGAVVTFFTGQLIWGYYAFPGNSKYVSKKAIFYYAIHSAPIIAIYFGFLQNWNFGSQIICDLILLIIANESYGGSRRFEQFDGSFSKYLRQIKVSFSDDETEDETEDENEDEDETEVESKPIKKPCNFDRPRTRSRKNL